MGVTCCQENRNKQRKQNTINNNEKNNNNNNKNNNRRKKSINKYNDEDLQSIDEFGQDNTENDDLAKYLPQDESQNINPKQKQLPRTKNIKSNISLEDLFESYYAAKEYFRLNGLREQELDAINKCRDIKKLKANPKLKDIEIPNEVTPEYIYGCSKQEKINKCKEIEKSFIEQKTYIKKNMEEYMENLKKLNPKKFATIKDQAKKKLDNDKLEIQKLDKFIKIINDIAKDKWTPVPEYLRVDKEKKIEKIQEDIPEKVMRIHVGQTTYTKSNSILKLEIKFDKKNNNNKLEEIKCKENNDFNESFDWEFDDDQWKNLTKNEINIILERSYNIKKNKIKGVGKIDLRKLRNEFNIEGNFPIVMKSKKEDKNVEISIDIRSPIINKIYDVVNGEVIEIKKIFPAFEPKIYGNDDQEAMVKRQTTKN